VRKVDWSAETSWGRVCRRASGRRRYNKWRAFVALYRQTKLLEMLGEHDWPFKHGAQAAMARHLGVSEATISRDLKSMFKSHAVCPTCQTMVHADQIQERHRAR
jgi:hypothetical protein